MTALAARLSELGWVSDLWVAGSLATGDHLPGSVTSTWSQSSTARRTRPASPDGPASTHSSTRGPPGELPSVVSM